MLTTKPAAAGLAAAADEYLDGEIDKLVYQSAAADLSDEEIKIVEGT